MSDKLSNINELPLYDVAVIGGGINGVGIANDAAGRGLSVFVCEKDDFASHTSSASSKLIHGGLRYLEHYEFRLVREALAEREVLMAKAPHIIRPLRFVLPHRPHLRSAWLIRSGLFLYDYLGKREKLAASRRLVLGPRSPLQSDIVLGFEYSDCAVDDARLVILNAIQAREKGAELVTRTRCVSAEVVDGVWVLNLQQSHRHYQITAKALVNAAGPWVEQILQDAIKLDSPYKIRHIQGSHLIVPKLYDGDYAYILQNEDRRIVFTIPYLNEYTLIGTTDRVYEGDLNQVKITSEEIEYLLAVVNAHFKNKLKQSDIIDTFSGVRPLCDDESDQPSAVTRDYTLASTLIDSSAPLLSVFGGKLTTYRKLAESALNELKPYFPELPNTWTEHEALPGGENFKTLEGLVRGIQLRIKDIPVEIAIRWASTYGTRIWRLLKDVRSYQDFGQHFAQGLYEVEVNYLIQFEWVQTADDILWRRTKLGLKFEAADVVRLNDYIQHVLGNEHSMIA